MYTVSKLGQDGATLIFQSQLESEQAVVGLLAEEAVGRFIVWTREADYVFNLKTGELEKKLETEGLTDVSRKWISHPSSDVHAVRVDGTEVRMYNCRDWAEVGRFSLALERDPGRMLKSVAISSAAGQEPKLVLEFSGRNGSSSTSGIAVFDAAFLAVKDADSALGLEDEMGRVVITDDDGDDTDGAVNAATESRRTMAPLSSFITAFSPNIAHVIGVDNSGRLVFLDRSSWVCSSGLLGDKQGTGDGLGKDSVAKVAVSRHFFIPYDWFAGRRDIVCALVEGDIILTRGGDLAVIRGGFGHAESLVVG